MILSVSSKDFPQSGAETFLCAPSELDDVLHGLLDPEQSRRMTLDQLLLQPWISQPISLSEYSWAEVVPESQSCCEYCLMVLLLGPVGLRPFPDMPHFRR